jgi:hypothetical protein
MKVNGSRERRLKKALAFVLDYYEGRDGEVPDHLLFGVLDILGENLTLELTRTNKVSKE